MVPVRGVRSGVVGEVGDGGALGVCCGGVGVDGGCGGGGGNGEKREWERVDRGGVVTAVAWRASAMVVVVVVKGGSGWAVWGSKVALFGS